MDPWDVSSRAPGGGWRPPRAEDTLKIVSSPTRISARIAAIAESATLKVDAKAKALQAEGRPVISYAAGEPDFRTPQHIVEAASAAVLDPKNYRYTPPRASPTSAPRSPRRRRATPAGPSTPRRSS